jgi:hypothetical protein
MGAERGSPGRNVFHRRCLGTSDHLFFCLILHLSLIELWESSNSLGSPNIADMIDHEAAIRHYMQSIPTLVLRYDRSSMRTALEVNAFSPSRWFA